MDGAIDRTLRQTWAFVFRGYHLTRRYISWVIVFNFYALTGSAAVALIGVAAHDHQLTLTLVVGALLDRKSTRLNSSHTVISYAVFCLKKKKSLTDHSAGHRSVPRSP